MSSASRSKTTAALGQLAARLRHAHRPPAPPGQRDPVNRDDPRPPSLEVLEERIRGLQARVDELTARINATMLLLAGAVATQIVIALLKP